MRGILSLKGLLEKIHLYNPDADLELLKKAYHFSREAHCSQKRSEGSPYIKHPLEVAYILADMKMDVPSISAGLLHDTIEDTIVTIADIKGIFGDGTETADIIQLVASHVTVSNCYIQNLGLEISDYYSCVRIGDEVEDSAIEGCTISDCIVSRSIIGIFCQHVGPLDNTTLINNRVFGCQSFGMLIESDNDTTTEGDFTISGNVIIDCTIGIYLKSDRENVSWNSIRLCDFGITLHGNQNIIYGNDFDNCSVGVCDYDLPAHDNVITKNNFKSYSRGKLWWAKPPSYITTMLNIFKKKEWKQNYWDTWRGLGPKAVPGGFILGEKIPIIWFSFDWRPAKEPYTIPNAS